MNHLNVAPYSYDGVPSAGLRPIASARNATSGTTLVITNDSGVAIPVGTRLLVAVVSDNASATTPTFTMVDSVSNTYTNRAQNARVTTAASGLAAGVFTARVANEIPNGGTWTITLSNAVAAKAAAVLRMDGIGNEVPTVTGSWSSASSANSASAVTPTAVGQIVVAFGFGESNQINVFDSDTSNGSWSLPYTHVSGNSATIAANVMFTVQTKVVTSTAAQTHDLTWVTTTDYLAISFAFSPPQTVSLPTFSDGDTLNTPTVAAGGSAQSLSLPAISDADTVSTPTVTRGAVTLTAPAISDGDSLFTPTAAPAAVSLTLPSITDSDSVPTPTVTRGSVSATLPLITDADTLSVPTLAMSASLPTINDADSLLQPSVALSLVLPSISDSDSLFTPTVGAPGANLALPTITDSDTVSVPTVATGPTSVVLPSITDGDSLSTPALAQRLVLPAITDSDTLLVPSAAPGPVTLSLPAVADGDTVSVPTLTPGAVAVTLPAISDADAVHQLTLGLTVVLPALADSDLLYPPSLPTIVVLPAISDGDSLFAPIVGSFNQTIVLPFLNNTRRVLLFAADD